MNKTVLSLLCDPVTHESLELRSEIGVNERRWELAPLTQDLEDSVAAIADAYLEGDKKSLTPWQDAERLSCRRSGSRDTSMSWR